MPKGELDIRIAKIDQIMFVVSDKFSAFAINDGVISYSDLRQALRDWNAAYRKATVVVGQGLDTERLHVLEREIEQHGLQDRVVLVPGQRNTVNRRLVHKHQAENVYVANLMPIAPDTYEASLYIDDRCAEMSDHVTGQHVQGTLLIEASRQMMMAGIETYVAPTHESGTYAYALSELHVQYYKFVFPVDIGIRLRIENAARDKRGVLALTLAVSFYQYGECVCDVRCSASGYPPAWVDRLEARQARRCADVARSHWLDCISIAPQTEAVRELERRPKEASSGDSLTHLTHELARKVTS